MRRIVHLSDVHFGTTNEQIVNLVVEKVNELAPHVVVVSGDLTQRAKSVEFKQARAFLDRLPHPQIVVPGNHDVPMYNVYDRFFRKLEKFQKYITEDLNPAYVDEEIAIVGVNTARSFTIKSGRINDGQVDYVKSKFCALNSDILKVLVTHHPFDLPEGFNPDDIVERAEGAMRAIAACGGDVFMAGHMHVSNIETTAKRYNLENGRNALVIQAGTATSHRVRGEAHSFNLIDFERPRLRIERYECRSLDSGFKAVEEKLYEQIPNGWRKLGE